jgi:hypothetical protein
MEYNNVLSVYVIMRWRVQLGINSTNDVSYNEYY